MATMLIRRLRRLLGQTPPPIVSVVRLSGIIGGVGGFRPGLTIAATAPLLERAFEAKDQAAVALIINSPGGSPVQSALIGGRIRALADEKKLPVIAFVEDVAASGGYWLACAADEIVADPSSVVGSIGVVSRGFGFPEALRRLGIERRVHTSGTNKNMLDPFQPERAEDVERLKSLQEEVHESFKDWVRRRRGPKLTVPEADLFTGEFWTGTRGLALGLVDRLGDARTVLRERYGTDVKIRMVGQRRSLIQRLGGGESRIAGLPGSADLGAGIAAGLLAAAEERALWQRYGL